MLTANSKYIIVYEGLFSYTYFGQIFCFSVVIRYTYYPVFGFLVENLKKKKIGSFFIDTENACVQKHITMDIHL